jgi:hypothetical protein
LGIDELGREVVSWIPGATAASGDEIELLQLARMVRQLHDLTVELVDDGFECVIHDDLQPRNVVVLDRFPSGLDRLGTGSTGTARRRCGQDVLVLHRADT